MRQFWHLFCRKTSINLPFIYYSIFCPTNAAYFIPIIHIIHSRFVKNLFDFYSHCKCPNFAGLTLFCTFPLNVVDRTVDKYLITMYKGQIRKIELSLTPKGLRDSSSLSLLHCELKHYRTIRHRLPTITSCLRLRGFTAYLNLH